MSTAIQLPSDVTVGTEPIPTGTSRAFVFGSKVFVPGETKVALHASNYIAVPVGHAYILGSVRETIYNRGFPFSIPPEVTTNIQLLSCIDIIECAGHQEAFLRIKMAGPLSLKAAKPDICDSVHLIKLQLNTLVEIKNNLVGDTYDKSDFSDGSITQVEAYFARIDVDEVPVEKAEIKKIESDCTWRIEPMKKVVKEDGSFEFDGDCEGFSQSVEYVGLLKRQTTRGTVPVTKKRTREIAEEDFKTRLETAEDEIQKYQKVFPTLMAIPGTSGFIAVTTMGSATQTTIDGNIAFILGDDKQH